MYQDQVFCFTPKGSLISCRAGRRRSTFAYAVHTDLGNSAVGAKVNGNHVPLHTPLKNGDQVEIITMRDSSPSPMWEQFVVTGPRPRPRSGVSCAMPSATSMSDSAQDSGKDLCR
jgi:GTP pyrophosphokinase